MLQNAVKIIFGKLSWVGYASGGPDYLPHIRRGALLPYNFKEGYQPSADVIRQVNIAYAQNYSTTADMNLIIKNFRYLGGY